jgi:LemA protein
MTTDPMLPALGFAAGGALLGWFFVRAMSRQDHRTWVMARAPALPIRSLAAGDDAWIRGIVRTTEPLRCPHFGERCVAYAYSRERKHTKTVRDKDGNTRTETEWRTEHSESDAIDFELDDGERILVRGSDADNEALASLATDYEGLWLRHSASVLEVGAVISVLGVKQGDASFAGEREVPCLLTRVEREARVRSSARSEEWLFFFGCLLPLLGIGGGALWWFANDGWEPLQLADWLFAIGSGVLGMLPFWLVTTWNRLVRLRHQVGAAFRQVDVDLSVRAALVPNLRDVVAAYAAHEKTLLESLGAIRSGHDERGEAAVREVLLLHEAYPALRGDLLYRDLHDRLWALEEKLAHTRQLYNDIATEWNDRIAHFPQSLVSNTMKCRPAPLFAGDDEALPPRLVD